MNNSRGRGTFCYLIVFNFFLISTFSCKSWGLFDLLHNISENPEIPETPLSPLPTSVVLNLAGQVSTFAGAAPQFFNARAVVSDGTNLYVADSGNHTIQKVVIATGAVSTFVGQANVSGSSDGIGTTAQFNSPEGITLMGQNLYVADTINCTIRKIDIATTMVTTYAGSANICTSPNPNGIGTAATFNYPKGITSYVSVSGSYLYVIEGTAIRLIDSSVNVTTLSLSGNLVGAVGITFVPTGYGVSAAFYITDQIDCTIKRLSVAGPPYVVTIVAGTSGSCGNQDDIGTAALFNIPTNITNDGTSVYITDTGNHKIRKFMPNTGAVTTIAGSGTSGGLDNTLGTAAGFNSPYGIIFSGTNLFVSDSGNKIIRQVSTTGNFSVSTLAGNLPVFNSPFGITSDGTNLYVADSANHVIRKVELTTGAVTTFAGNPGVLGSSDGMGTSARFSQPNGITTDGTNLYVADTGNHIIRRIDLSNGNVTTLAGSAGIQGSNNGTGSSASFNNPTGITIEGSNLYIVEKENHDIRKLEIATANVTSFAGDATIGAGFVDGIGAAASFNLPFGITTDGTNLYVADGANHAIRKIGIADQAVSTIADINQGFNFPVGITTDGSFLYITDVLNNTISKFEIGTGVVTIIAGSTGVTGSLDGIGTAALFNQPAGVAIAGTSLYITELVNNTIRRID